MSDNLIKWREENLNSISKSFCAAKWFNASLHLGHGYTNSCHLPLPHPIDLEEIKTNPSALHNTKLKKEARRMMQQGIRPAECSYCWKVEDVGRNNVSDRVFKSIIYPENEIAELKERPWDKDINLKTVEVSFDRTCNFACSYCNSGYSTTWGRDIRENGPYQKFKSSSAGAYHSDGSWSEIYGKNGENNPYVQAFMEWWPELSQTLQEVRITGGEPSTSFNFWNFVEVMKQNPSPNLNMAVNSNLGVDDKLIDKLIQSTHEIDVKNFDLYTSNESFGAHAEYIRDGLKYDVWRKNVVRIIEEAKCRQLVIMMTINSLCLFSITEFLDDMITLKKKYGQYKLVVDLNILRWPAFMSPVALPNHLKQMVHDKLKEWFNKSENKELLHEGEVAQIQRVIDYVEVVDKGHIATENEMEKHFHDFKSFYEQYDKRRGKNFCETFPELADWYNSIEVDRNIPNVSITDGRITNYEIGEYKGGKVI
jgi:organic radical activating enzyme